MAESRVWVVRTGPEGEFESLNLDRGVVSVGWPELPDTTGCASRAAMADAVLAAYPHKSAAVRGNWTGQLWRFQSEMQPGDLVLMPQRGRPLVHVGRIIGPFAYREDLPPGARRTRPVEWLGSFPRAAASTGLQNTLGSLLTVFEVQGDDVDARVESLLADGSDPLADQEPGAAGAGTARVHELLRAMCDVLVDEPDGVAAGEAITAVREVVPPHEDELTRNESGNVRYDTKVRFWSIDLVKAGWLDKRGGRWYLTEAGRVALETFPDPQDFGAEAIRRYRAWRAASEQSKSDRETWQLADAVISRIPPGRWVTFSDLSEAVGRGTSQIGTHLWGDRPPGWHRVLRVGGNLPADYFDPDRADEHRRLLAEEGVEADPIPPEDRRLSLAEVRGLVAEVTGAPRAWLIRGSAVDGVNIVPTWLERGYVSLAARQLPPLPTDADDAAIKNAVEAGYSHLGYSQRQAKFEEVRAFLRRIRAGHLVLTTSESEVFVGEVTGGAEQVDSDDRRSNLRRAVSWDNADSPLDTVDLSPRLLGGLRSSAVLLDLTDVYPDVAALRPSTEPDPVPQPVPVPAVTLRPLPDDVSDSLLVGRGWLDEFVELLAERRQVILYGPPGTGKTYLAQAVAEALAGPERVTLVQFHPAYSYEDFFEGYRPTMGDAGQVGFRLVPGPFRKVVDAARADPGRPYVLIIDEINRGNLAKVFGELYFLLEYRDRTISLLYSSEETSQFSMPDNVFLIGTMNTADRSIALVDAAMRRRFGFLSLHPDDDHLAGVLPRWLAEHDLPADRTLLLAALNARIDDREFRIGPSYLMRESAGTDAGLDRIWRTSILPLLEEHHAGDDVDVEHRYGLAALRRAVAATSVEAGAEAGAEPSAEPSMAVEMPAPDVDVAGSP